MARPMLSLLHRLMTRLALALTLALIGGPAAVAQVAKTAHVTAELISEQATIAPGKPFMVGLKLTMAPGWHTYWRNPGDAGTPTSIEWKLPSGFAAGEIAWPSPSRLPYQGLTNYGYEGTVVLPIEITPPANLGPGRAALLLAQVAWLVCADVCIPEHGEVGIALDVGSQPKPASQATLDLFASTRAAMPSTPAGWTFAAERNGDGYLLVGTATSAAVPATDGAFFYSATPMTIAPGAKQPLRFDGKHLVAQLQADKGAASLSRISGDWVVPAGWPGGGRSAAIDVPVGDPGSAISGQVLSAMEGSSSSSAKDVGSGLLLTMVLGFVGGLLLNLMPCVFPVIGLKVLGFLRQSGNSSRSVVAHGLAFTAGVLLSLWSLAVLLIVMRSGGSQLGWGFQLQSPWFVFLLSALFLVFALNLSGVFEFGLSATRAGNLAAGRHGIASSFLSGLLAAIVATPCSAPFLAPALGAALTLPPASSLALFTAIGLGLSLPYLVLSARPSLVRFLPRPGPWMDTFKRIMAFPLYATVVYLLWVLAGQLPDARLLSVGWGLVILAAAVWAYGHWSTGRRPGIALGAAIALGVAGLALGWPRSAPSQEEVQWQPWSQEQVAALTAAKRTVYVDFTARWCATCQVNKKLVFGDSAVQRVVAQNNVALLRADWTSYDPAITAELAKYGRNAIPFTLVYSPGRAEPQILPEVLTPQTVIAALEP